MRVGSCREPRQLALCASHARAPATSCQDSPRASVFYLLKTSSGRKWVERTLSGLGTWLQWTRGRLGLLTDDNDPGANELLARCAAIPRAAFRLQPGNFYADRGARGFTNISEAQKVTRAKTRLAWETFLQRQGGEDWLCYFDDDTYVTGHHTVH